MRTLMVSSTAVVTLIALFAAITTGAARTVKSTGGLVFESLAVVGNDYRTGWGESPQFTVAVPYSSDGGVNNGTGVALLCNANSSVKVSTDGGRTFESHKVTGEPGMIFGASPHVPMPATDLSTFGAVSVAADEAINSNSPQNQWITPDRWLYAYHPENGTFTTTILKEGSEVNNAGTKWTGFPFSTYSFRIVSGGITQVPSQPPFQNDDGETTGTKKNTFFAVAALWPWDQQGPCCNLSVHSFKSVDGTGKLWTWTGMVANKTTLLTPPHHIPSEEGPNECNIAVLKDNRTLLSVFRIDGGDGVPNHRRVPYGVATSTDGGVNWDFWGQLPAGIGAVFPRLRRLNPSGALVLAGGRPGLKIWLNTQGGIDSQQGTFSSTALLNGWKEYDIPFEHNKRIAMSRTGQNKVEDKYQFCEPFINASTCIDEGHHNSWSQSTCYNSLNALNSPFQPHGVENPDDADTAVLCYERQGLDIYGQVEPKECRLRYDTVFCMRVRYDANQQ